MVYFYDKTDFQDNFRPSLKDPKEFWLIEFYASWCGHCVHFAPTVKNFAQDIKHWSRLVNFGVLDCGNPGNRQICSDNAISGKIKKNRHNTFIN